MKLSGGYDIAAPRARVWAALNDPDTLGRCIPGCEEIARTGDGGFDATAKVRIGPVQARFKGKVTLDDLNPPESYTLRGEGQGGVAGFAKGEARVRLSETEGGTRLDYDVDASVGGRIAQVGQRLIDGAAKKMADAFFTAFARELGPAAPAAAAPSSRAVSPVSEEGLPTAVWLGGLVAALGILLVLMLFVL